ncbi:MAG: hypothetical protein IJ679_11605, partial [Lachnospiraceae bacterium]|nr:hypothetical protein [Lachnospiraceae bacterium]
KEDKPDVPADVLADAYASMLEFAEQMDVDLMEMVLDSLDGYRLSKEDAGRIEEIRACLMRLDWDPITKQLKEAI